eukprot:16432854-Heterocapsa_arctica.AAC.1
MADSRRTRFLSSKNLPDEKGCWLCAKQGCAMKLQIYPWGMEGPSLCISHWNHMIDKTREKSLGLPEWVIPCAWIGENILNKCYPLLNNGSSHSSPDCIRECAGLYEIHIGNTCFNPSQHEPPDQEPDGRIDNDTVTPINVINPTYFDHDLVNNDLQVKEFVEEVSAC